MPCPRIFDTVLFVEMIKTLEIADQPVEEEHYEIRKGSSDTISIETLLRAQTLLVQFLTYHFHTLS